MLVIGITGGNKSGKTAVGDMLDAMLEAAQPELVVERVEMSQPARNLLDSLGIDVDEKTGEVRSMLQDLMEIPMRRSETIWLDAAVRESVGLYGSDQAVDVMIISGIRRACEAGWVRARGGIMMHVSGIYGETLLAEEDDLVVVSPRIDSESCEDLVRGISRLILKKCEKQAVTA